MLFTQENTVGYADAELDQLNAEWAEIVQAEDLELDTDEYEQRSSQFQDAVSRR